MAMKWEIIDDSPKIGEVRFKTKFAWLPTRVLSKLTNTDHRIWFELYIEEQEYVKQYELGWEKFIGWKTVAKTIHI
jgi:hypothetical protein